MPALRTYPKRSNRRQAGSTQNTLCQKRNVDITMQNGEPDSSAGDRLSLDWDWVKTLDQDPTKKEYFPVRFTTPLNSSVGDDHDQPKVTNDTDMPDYTAWVLARIKRTLVSKAITSMVQDPNPNGVSLLTAKFTIKSAVTES
ncbi:hypothetical protein F4781DRAFT_445122 [Annulohypoxylon bovei var. microspora]|nr:hypothetical protein F4781DRAFT_445122 [Annulohypoxylon bovei var. microspora]